jgi:hypothetical protein
MMSLRQIVVMAGFLSALLLNSWICTAVAQELSSAQRLQELQGQWVSIDDEGTSNFRLVIGANKNVPRCTIQVSEDGVKETCVIQRKGASLAINSEAPVDPQSETEPTHHVILAQLMGDVLQGLVLPDRVSILLYRQGSATERQRRNEIESVKLAAEEQEHRRHLQLEAAVVAKRAEEEATFSDMLQSLPGQWTYWRNVSGKTGIRNGILTINPSEAGSRTLTGNVSADYETREDDFLGFNHAVQHHVDSQVLISLYPNGVIRVDCGSEGSHEFNWSESHKRMTDFSNNRDMVVLTRK